MEHVKMYIDPQTTIPNYLVKIEENRPKQRRVSMWYVKNRLWPADINSLSNSLLIYIYILTAALSSRSKWLSTLCFVTVLATPFEWRPSNCLDRRLPNHLSKRGVIPLIKKSHTLHPGAQIPHPGPLPTAPYNNNIHV